MSFEPRPGARGSRSAKRAFAAERRGEQLKRDGALTNEIEVAARAQAEAIQCPICNKPVHPSNFAKHNRNNHPDGKPLHELNELIPLAAIRVDGGTQPRAATNEDTISEYAEAMQDGATFPALVVFYDGTDYWLADGFHRFYAAQLIGLKEFAADVKQGTQRDAILHSVGANSTHGLRRTNADKRRAVERLLRDDEWVKWSNNEIARRCSVHPDTVGVYRKELSLSDSDSEPRTYTTKHGTTATMNTSNIGQPPRMTPPEPHPESKFAAYAGQPAVKPPASEPVRYVGNGDDYVPDEGDSFVPDVEVVDLTEPGERVGDVVDLDADAQPDATEPLVKPRYHDSLPKVYDGAKVKTAAGHEGVVISVTGRIAIVETQNGKRPYDVENLTLVPPPEPVVETFDYKRDAKTTRPADETTSQPFDFCQTPGYALDPLFPYLGWSMPSTIWEPAAGELMLVDALYDGGWKQENVVATDILTGQNFFEYEPEHYEIIVTNPPYSLKFKWLERCYQLGKPFALLLPVETLGAVTAQALMQQYGFEMMLLDSRVDFKMPNKGFEGSAQFPVFWLTWNLLPEKVMFGSISEGKRKFNNGTHE